MRQIKLVYPEGKFKALTLSYDDGRTADRRLVEILNTYGIKGTFHINAGLLEQDQRIPADEIAELYEGHEVSAHTWSHPTIARSPKEAIIYELMEDRKRLEDIVGYPIRGMSYPNGSYNEKLIDMLPFLGIEYGRVVPSTQEFSIPQNWYQWQPTCHHKHQLQEKAEQFAALHKSQYLYLMYVWGHSYEFDQDNNWEVIEQFCQYIGGRDDIWYATNIEICDYHHKFDQLQFAANGKWVVNPFASSIWLNVDGQFIEAKGGQQTSLI